MISPNNSKGRCMVHTCKSNWDCVDQDMVEYPLSIKAYTFLYFYFILFDVS